jgi:hypothetical protein
LLRDLQLIVAQSKARSSHSSSMLSPHPQPSIP